MLIKSFKIFFVNPVVEIWESLKSYTVFLYKFISNTVLLQGDLNVSEEDLLMNAFRIFRGLMFIILFNFSINEVFSNIDSDLSHELKSELGYLLFFYIEFILLYFLSSFYTYITKNKIHKSIILQNWLSIIMVATIIFQVTGVLNPGDKNKSDNYETVALDFIFIFIVMLFVFLFQVIKLIKCCQLKWHDSVFYFTVFIIFSSFIFFKALFIKYLINN
jgi:hypothetical protein